MEGYNEGVQGPAGLRPPWYGRRYPSLDDLVAAAEGLGAKVGWAAIGQEALFVAGDAHEPPVILLPTGTSPLRTAWLLAHELGHLHQHEGPKTAWTHGRDEARADRWAACALIPEAAVRRHRNACEDAFIAALSRHYEELPMHGCPSRGLAGRIAGIRLRCIRIKPVEVI
jgi:hypothetical protein